MAKVSTVVVAVALTVGAAYGIAKGYVHYRIGKGLDQAKTQFAIFGQLDHEGIETELFQGTAIIRGLRLIPHGVDDAIEVDALRVEGPGPGFLFGADMQSLTNQPPEHVGLQMLGLSMRLDSGLARMISDAYYESQREIYGLRTLPGPCEVGNQVTPGDMLAMGFDRISADVIMSLDYDPIAETLVLEWGMDFDGMDDFSIRFSADGVRPGAGSMPEFGEVEFVWDADPGYWDKRFALCSKRQDKDRTTLVKEFVEADDEEFLRAYKLAPGPGLRAALQSFMQAPGRVEVKMEPGANFNPMLLQAVRPEDIPGMLRMSVMVNGEAVTDLSFHTDLPEGGSLEDLLVEEGIVDDGSGTARGRLARPQIRYAFQDTALRELPSHLGAQVRLHLKDGRIRAGILNKVNAEQAEVEQRLQGGKFSTQVPFGDIARAEVMRRVPKKAADSGD